MRGAPVRNSGPMTIESPFTNFVVFDLILFVRWDSLTTEFFDDDAVLKISCYLEDGLKHFAVSKLYKKIFWKILSKYDDLMVILDWQKIDSALFPFVIRGRGYRWIFCATNDKRNVFRIIFNGRMRYGFTRFERRNNNGYRFTFYLVTTHTKPVYGIVTTDGRLSLEFTFEEQMRIKNWHFLIRG